AKRSGHSRGSTVDLTIVPLPVPSQETYRDGAPLRDCALPADRRFQDNSLDFGTGWDCFDPLSNLENPSIPLDAKVRRLALRALMEKRGFKPYKAERWHFTPVGAPYPDIYCDCEVQSRARTKGVTASGATRARPAGGSLASAGSRSPPGSPRSPGTLGHGRGRRSRASSARGWRPGGRGP